MRTVFAVRPHQWCVIGLTSENSHDLDAVCRLYVAFHEFHVRGASRHQFRSSQTAAVEWRSMGEERAFGTRCTGQPLINKPNEIKALEPHKPSAEG